jgi:hypothetical protein
MMQSFNGVGLSPTMRRTSCSSQNFHGPLSWREKIRFDQDPLRSTIADLHVINTRLHAGVVHAADHVVAEAVIVHQSAVADGDVDHLDFRTIRDPLAGELLFGFSLLHRDSFLCARLFPAAGGMLPSTRDPPATQSPPRRTFS